MSNTQKHEDSLGEPKHHYYGHVQDLEGVDLTNYFLLPVYALVLIFCIVTGLWPLLLIFWFFKR